MKKLLIIDVSNLFYRCFYGSTPLITSKGIPVQALHGFVRGMNSLIKERAPDYIALAMEGSGPSFRKAIEPLYKANRSELPNELKGQLKLLPDLIEALGFKSYRYPGFEADDVIGTLVIEARRKFPDIEVEIVSSDKDFSQLVDEKANIFDLAKNLTLGVKEIHNKYGIWPEQFVDYLAIVGDTSDNIKGVQGIGPKGALKLLQQFKTLEGIYVNLSSIKTSMQVKLLQSKDEVFKAKKLAKINTEVPLTLDLNEVEYQGPIEPKLRKMFRELEFKDLEISMLGPGVQILGGIEIGVRS
jgi:DNA polymerase-1